MAQELQGLLAVADNIDVEVMFTLAQDFTSQVAIAMIIVDQKNFRHTVC
jgi:hypothetical protein